MPEFQENDTLGSVRWAAHRNRFTHGHWFKADQWRKPAEMAFRKARQFGPSTGKLDLGQVVIQ